jgi:DNA repair exonuclease SbcCD ATPase subunit
MLRNILLGGISHLALYAPEDEKGADKPVKSAVELQRESIVVENNNTEEKKVEAKEEAKEEDKEEVEETAEVEDKKEEIAASEDKVDDLEEQLEDKTLTAKERERLENRIQKERKKNQELRKELEEANKQLAARPTDEKVFTEDEIERRADAKATQKQIEREFEASVNRIAKEAEKIDPAYKDKVAAMSEDYNNGMIPGAMIDILDNLPNHGGDVLMYLTKNEDEYEEIHALSPAKMALRLKDISDKIKKPIKQASKVPAPNDPLKGKGNSPEVLRDDMPMEDFARIRAQQVEARRKQKLGLH